MAEGAPHHWRFDASLITTVDVRFELEHRDLERYGADAERMREIFAAPDAWDRTLADFAEAVA